jgi:hypothetical protein
MLSILEKEKNPQKISAAFYLLLQKQKFAQHLMQSRVFLEKILAAHDPSFISEDGNSIFMAAVENDSPMWMIKRLLPAADVSYVNPKSGVSTLMCMLDRAYLFRHEEIDMALEKANPGYVNPKTDETCLMVALHAEKINNRQGITPDQFEKIITHTDFSKRTNKNAQKVGHGKIHLDLLYNFYKLDLGVKKLIEEKSKACGLRATDTHFRRRMCVPTRF